MLSTISRTQLAATRSLRSGALCRGQNAPLRRLRVAANWGVRRGITLAEVMIALFVLAIGMMGILALFPLGAAQMAQAVKDERAAQLADLGEAHMRILWRTAWLDANGALKTDAQAMVDSPELTAFDSATAAPNSSGPSSPVYIDPIGYETFTGTGNQTSVGGGYLPRRTITPINNLGNKAQRTAACIRLCGLLDDISFGANGLTGSPVNRGNRYNSAFLLQRPKNNVRHEVNLKVVVYQSRPPADTPSAETFLSMASITPGSENVSFNVTGLPSLRKGSWLLFTSTGGGNVEPFADFHRITSINQQGAAFSVSVSPPFRQHSLGSSAYSASVLQLDNVVEVFDRGTITPYEVPAQ